MFEDLEREEKEREGRRWERELDAEDPYDSKLSGHHFATRPKTESKSNPFDWDNDCGVH